eukprot:1375545-Rhodomonas_salina.5
MVCTAGISESWQMPTTVLCAAACAMSALSIGHCGARGGAEPVVVDEAEQGWRGSELAAASQRLVATESRSHVNIGQRNAHLIT